MSCIYIKSNINSAYCYDGCFIELFRTVGISDNLSAVGKRDIVEINRVMFTGTGMYWP